MVGFPLRLDLQWVRPREANPDVGVDVLRDKYKRPVPAADLLMADPYKELMPLVVDAKDLGSGVIRGVECDHLAFRTEEVDLIGPRRVVQWQC